MNFKIRWCGMLAAVALSVASVNAGPAGEAPYLVVLGVTQDAGYPQAGCYRPHCMPGWADRDLRRTVVSLGLVDPESGRKYLFEATPTDAVSRSASRMSRLIAAATSGPVPNSFSLAVTSRKASSSESPSTSGVNWRNTSNTCFETAR